MANGILPQFGGTICSMLKQRVEQLKQNFKKEKVDAVLISSVSTIEYLTGYSNFSKDEREAYLLIGQDFQYIITDGRYTEAVKREVSHLTLFERSHKTPTEKLLKILKNKIKILGIEEDNLTISEYKLIKKHFKKIKHFNAGHLRSIKSGQEIDKIKSACKIGDKAFKYILKRIKVGVTEKQIAEELENFIKRSNAALSFPPIIAFGKNASIPHHQTGNAKLKKGDFVLLDFGAKVNGYCSDMTRTIFFGKPSKKQKEIYRVVLEAQQKAVEFVNKQLKSAKLVKAAEVDRIAREYIASHGFPAIPHSLGHGIGLEVHEHPSLSPKSKEVLKMGMIFSIEPGIYVPDFGGVRIEDLYVLEKGVLKQITTSPKNIIQI